MADPHLPGHVVRRARIEASVFATSAALHAPGAAVALGHLTPTTSSAILAAASVVASLLLWASLAVLALRACRRDRLVSRGLLAGALAVDTVVLTISGLSPVRPGNTTAAAVGLIALCAAAALLTRPRLLPVVLLPAVGGQAVLLHAADAATTTARLVADLATVTAASAATAVLIAWLEHERRAGQESLARAALTDPLTGLLNRRGLDHELTALTSPAATGAARRHRRRAEEAAAGAGGSSPAGDGARAGLGDVHVVVIDIDHFKSVNDRRGHDVGDEVLVLVSRALRDCSRRGDLLVRLGGEELAWVARWSTAQDAVAAAERVRVLVSDRTGDHGEVVTISAGVAEVVQGGEAGDVGPLDTAAAVKEALVRADRALYRAKAAGRDRVEVAPGGELLEPAVASE